MLNLAHYILNLRVIWEGYVWCSPLLMFPSYGLLWSKVRARTQSCFIGSILRSNRGTRPLCFSSKIWEKKTLAFINAVEFTPPMKKCTRWSKSPPSVNMMRRDTSSPQWRHFCFFHFAVGITWDDAPTEQHAVINTDYKIRCVVLASPPATIDWLKESLIVSTGRFI